MKASHLALSAVVSLALAAGVLAACSSFSEEPTPATVPNEGGEDSAGPDATTIDAPPGADAGAGDAASEAGCNSCERIVFVTTALYTGNIGGLAGADARCNTAASASTLARVKGRPFKAWLSTQATSAKARLTHGAGPYKTPKGTLVANDFAGLTSGALKAAIVHSESGLDIGPADVWTGTTTAGDFAGDGTACNSWTTLSGQGQFGRSDTTNASWTAVGTQSCSTAAHLYCIED